MGIINLLDRELTNMIAAGEVVERPASVVKELVENSIDAGATTIIVEIKDGGKTYIRVSDNGTGMELDDARNAFKCHATSKISKKDDLFKIKTMGFRGEAVPAIASVSNVELLTSTEQSKFGTRLVFEAGTEVVHEEVGFAKGTTFIVRDLFYNVPARLKFLKKDATETSNIVSLINKLAIGNPHISFQLIVDGKLSFSTDKNIPFIDLIYTVFGADITDNLLPVKLSENNIEIEGYAGKPCCSRSNRNFQLFYVNGRIVKSKTIIAAIDRAYQNKLMNGKHAVVVLRITIPPSEVDVNVHPTKTEVRFSNDQKIFDSVYYSIKTVLEKENTYKSVDIAEVVSPKPPLSSEERYQNAVENYYKGVNIDTSYDKSIDISTLVTDTKEQSEETDGKAKSSAQLLNCYMPIAYLFDSPEVKNKFDTTMHDDGFASRYTTLSTNELSDEYVEENRKELVTFFETEVKFHYVGELFKTYLIVECGDDFYFIDKHAAHEKILFDKIYSSYKKAERYSQTLISGIPVALTPEENAVAWENKEKIVALGFDFDKFGRNEVLLRTIPYVMSQGDTVPTFVEVIDLISKNKSLDMTEFENKAIKMLACKAAIKAGHETSEAELKKFIEEIIKSGNVDYCPHGRPIICEFTKKGLEKAFKRIV